MPIYKVANKKKDGLQKYQVKVNYTDKYGNRKQVMRTAYGSQAAKDLEDQLLEQVNSQESLSKSKRFKDLYDDYISYISNEIRESSLAKKKQVFRCHILPFFENILVESLDVKILQEWKVYVYQKELKTQTMKNCYKELRAMFNYCVKMDYLTSNPLLKVGDFKDAYQRKPEMLFYTPDEFQKYKTVSLQRAKQQNFYDYYVFFCIAYYTGARKGEIHAMRWRNFDGSSISIENSICQKLKGEDVETPPKNLSSIRVVQLPSPLINILEEHKKRQQDIISDWRDNGFICGYYKPLRDSNIDNENRHISAKAGLKRIRVHDFRHSHASLLINGNINPLEVAHRLGHSTVDQTLKTYSHLFPSEAEKSLNILNEV